MAMKDLIKAADFKTEKHAPLIEVPANIKAGETFTVNVSVGKDIPHPNTTEHFISYIILYYKPNDGKFASQVGKVEFSTHGESTEGPNKGSSYADPASSFAVKISKPGTFTAMSYCNIHGLWESSVDVSL